MKKLVYLLMCIFSTLSSFATDDSFSTHEQISQIRSLAKKYNARERMAVIGHLIDTYDNFSMSTDVGEHLWKLYEGDRDFILAEITKNRVKGLYGWQEEILSTINYLDTLARKNNFPNTMSLNDYNAMGVWWALALIKPFDQTPFPSESFAVSFSLYQDKKYENYQNISIRFKSEKFRFETHSISQSYLQIPYVSANGLLSISTLNDSYGFKTPKGNITSCFFLGVGINPFLNYDFISEASAWKFFEHDASHRPEKKGNIDIYPLREFINNLKWDEKSQCELAFFHTFHESNDVTDKKKLIEKFSDKNYFSRVIKEFEQFGNEGFEITFLKNALHLNLPIPYPELNKNSPAYLKSPKIKLNGISFNSHDIFMERYLACLNHYFHGFKKMQGWIDQNNL